MGLPDDYVSSIDDSGNTVTNPLPGYENDIMATLRGSPSAQDISTILSGPNGVNIPWGKNPSGGQCKQ
jgi:hypothetical protein